MEATSMAGKVPARREAKKKPKDAAAKPKIQSLLDEPPQSVEVIKPKRKPRWEKETDEE
ncbi:MAG: hypothetical protein H0X16_06470 [Chloroflexi bacterium]|nr:hypothetical protein [Chloroflexota bacterium]HEV8053462.1 hypothetical protein [Candidatus Limnocylindrales bacterium]